MQENNEVKPHKPFYKRWWFIAGIAVVALIFISDATSQPKQQPENKEIKQTAVKQTEPKTEIPQKVESAKIEIGQEGFLRLGGNSTKPDDVVLLASSKDEFSQLSKAAIAKDTMGILELKGVFGVSSGTKVLVIESGVGIRKVRILSGVRAVDNDKIGLAGWVPMEFVVSK